MKQNQSSTTAEGMALVRAIESAKPADRRICYDPIARSLIPGFLYMMSKAVIDSGIYGHFYPGALEFLLVRERYIDDFLKTTLSEGLDQVVILGAGFDTRAYRIPGIDKTRVFEVDHPATQKVKIERIAKIVNPLPTNVSFVPVDFNTQYLGEQLRASGYDEHGRTLFIWQGVTMYLTAQAVDSTLAFIAHHSAPGSALIFDYFYNETLRDTGRPDVKAMQRAVKATQAIGEGILFGIDEGKLESFMVQRCFCDVHSADTGELKRLHLTGANAHRTVSGGVAIGSAKVAGDAK